MPVAKSQEIPVNVVGASAFGRYPKISFEKTYNMHVSDGWLVNYSGYQKKLDILNKGQGRGLFQSIRGKFLIAVAGSGVYQILPSLAVKFIGSLSTSTDEVSIDENLAHQICIVDGEAAYIVHYDKDTLAATLTKQALYVNNDILQPLITPNYVSYHNSFFLISSVPGTFASQQWYTFVFNTDTTIKYQDAFAIQTKPDNAVAIKRIPGRGNNILVLGEAVSELWTQVGGTENYRRAQSINIDKGCISTSTIASNDSFICWLAVNENNSPSIMLFDGNSVSELSTDGIDYLLQTIKRPDISTGFFFRQDGVLFYQVTFFDSQDNLTLFYSFEAKKFFHASDENLNFHPARQVVYFNETTYFISLRDASLYEMSTDYVTYNYNLNPYLRGEEIPRIRICKTIRTENSERFRVGQFTFWIEQGIKDKFQNSQPITIQAMMISELGDQIVTESGDLLITEGLTSNTSVILPRVDMSFSKDGNQTFSNVVSRPLNPVGYHRNQIRWARLGQANEFTIQLRFLGLQRFCVYDGTVQVVL